ncbi:hypothetical protein CONPUDRAFT_165136 [Coniophora puteana RWD-64-598 SS2]|uniref:F-box domain-containing protein n=1 Tax=Coniophora puteana (strain RWD-64-598) TaxID=741705 RepID=A0A5M3MNZ4_CONPW|nr:uncharacterized protein CONPUDRAFT_165136 [Coniophora puteana RWD-64-598 SS2]EIW80888.1 hypothetical protein CONPUDRAFT_165136 [Coniophora puteana RWD-64-598 SS2]
MAPTTSRMSSASIAFLPDDLLYETFLQCAGACLQPHIGPDVWPFNRAVESFTPFWRINDHLCSRYTSPGRPKCWDWTATRLMLVCKRWSALILDRRVLWSRPLFLEERSAQWTLSRSGNVPLIVRHALLGLADNSWFLNFMGQERGFSRCREVVIDVDRRIGGAYDDFLWLAQGWPSAAPLLEVLALGIPSGRPRRPNPLSTAFLQSATRLRTLALVNFPLESWSSVHLKNLTTFIFRSEGRFEYTTVRDIIRFLRNTPQLQTLVLGAPKSHFIEELTPVPCIRPVVALNCLSRLSLSGPRMHALDLFQHISLPPNVVLELRMYRCHPTDNVLYHLEEAIQERYHAAPLPLDPQTDLGDADHRGSLPTFDRVSVHFYRNVEVTITGFTAAADGTLHPAISIVLGVEGVQRPASLVAQVLRVLRSGSAASFALSSSRREDFDDAVFADEALWHGLWRALPALKILEIVNPETSLEPFMRSLMPPLPPSLRAGALEEEEGCPLPALEELHVCDSYSEASAVLPGFACLRQALKARAESGRRLRLLELRNWTAQVIWSVEEMRSERTVDEVVFNGFFVRG